MARQSKILCKVKDPDRTGTFYTIYKDGTWRHSDWSKYEPMGEWDLVYGNKAQEFHFFYRTDITASVRNCTWTCDGDDASRAIAAAILEAQGKIAVEEMLK